MSMNILFTSKHYDPFTGKLSYPLRGNTSFVGQECSLNALTVYNSFFNISLAKANNVLVLKFPIFTASNTYTMVDHTLTLADGFYTIDNLNAALNNFCLEQGLYLLDSAGDPVVFQQIVRNTTRYRLELRTYYVPTSAQATTLGFTNPAALVLNVGNLMVTPQLVITSTQTRILGIVAGTWPAAVTTSSAATWPATAAFVKTNTLVPQVSPVTSIIVGCNLVNNTYSDPTTLIAQVPLTAGFEQSQTFLPSVPLWSDCTTAADSIDLFFYDQTGARIIPYDNEMTVTLALRPKPK